LEISFIEKRVKMKRFHVHVAVKDLEQSTRFYSAMFGVEPTVVKPDYAKWMLDDPRINFAISQRGQAPGVNHLGMQAETDEELEGIHANLQVADTSIVAEKGVHCCYAKSDKYWVTDPQGVAWESFRSLGSVPLYGEEHPVAPGSCGGKEATSCCAPSETKVAATGCCSVAA
jgi:catechol 2,3-dioxygenase-like lactoylglutathione lyase family enzyme